ncbi:fructose-2,6-bisphosphatase TIGAR isoform X1 [Pantherophis guttatus]|uniref:Fructose-2,6-bisphosphatase TIGAR isoform X1 n=2 Tax=Pantherophis guttatus TaxID=94885 RepID=A0A6P9B0S9_PANGU|nr:fructose-2,6-bisphosphatase TIGAR isoform X1 [Pantherophis guttatus]XP_034261840.2 fructose-2,6-bisphosphatase TIGAR isoform X1 [Pantherophis guttatus]
MPGPQERAGNMCQCLFIIHGQTRYNKEKIMQGQGVDEPLSETGFKQANAAGMYLRHIRFTHVFTSDLIRAKQTTASILTHSQHCKEMPVKCDARLRERKYGVAEGRPLSDLKAMAKEAGEPYLSFTPPGGETLDEVKARVKDFFEYLCSLVAQEACLEKQVSPGTEENTETAEGSSATSLPNHHDGPELESNSEEAASGGLVANILVVSHGAYMRNWIGYFISDLQCSLPATLTKAELSSVTPNTGISRFIVKLEMRESLLPPQIRCLFLNRSDHLRDMSDS